MTVMRIAGLIVNVLALGFLVGCVRNDSEVITNHDDVVGSRRAAGEHNANVSEGPAPASRNVTEFFTRFDSALESKRFEDALDFLRAAMVVAPGDERTLQAAERFVAAATAEAEKQDQGAEVFVDVGIDQLEGLIPFQQPDRIPHVRARVRELRAARTVEYPVVDPVKALHGELKLVAASKARVEVKLRSLHAIRAELESLEALALREGRELSSTIDVEIDRVEFEVLAEAYQPLRERRKAWVNDQVIPTINRINEQPSAPQRMQLETDCLKLLNDAVASCRNSHPLPKPMCRMQKGTWTTPMTGLNASPRLER